MSTTIIPAKVKSVTALMVALLVACIAFQLNASMLSPALATMGKELNTDQATIGLSQTFYFTAAALFSLFLPRLGDIIGRRKVLLAMMALMAIGSIICALAPNVGWLFVGRVVQGVTGPTVPLCLIMLRTAVVEPKRYGTLLGLITAVNGGVAGVDAFAGGFMVQALGFRSIFWLMVILAAVAALLVALMTPESTPGKGTRMDWLGVVLIVIAVGSLLTAFNDGAALPAAFSLGLALRCLVLLVVGVLAFVAFWFTEKRVKQPMVAVQFLRQRTTWATLLTTLLTMTGVFAVINGLVPNFAQSAAAFGLDPTATSLLLLTPYALVGWIVGPFSGRFAASRGYNTVLRFGLIGSIVALVIIAVFGLHNLPMLVVGTVLLGIAYAGCANIVLNGLGVVLSPDDNPGFLPGMNAGAFNLGAGISFVVLPTFLVGFAGLGEAGSNLVAILFGAVLVVVAFALSFLIPKPVLAEVGAENSQQVSA